jgi:hypothetical protein
MSPRYSRVCSGLIKPDTNIGGKITTVSEVFNEEATSAAQCRPPLFLLDFEAEVSPHTNSITYSDLELPEILDLVTLA